MYEKILEEAKKKDGIITTSDVEKMNYSRMTLTNMVKDGLLVREDSGIYLTQDADYDEFYIFQLKHPNAIFSHNTALYFFNKTERTPIKIDVTVHNTYNASSFGDTYVVYYVKKEILNMGVTEVVSPQGQKVKCYNLERTVCDIIKNTKNIDIETRNKAIKECIRDKSFDGNLMYEYAKKMGIYKKLSTMMEVLIW